MTVPLLETDPRWAGLVSSPAFAQLRPQHR